MYQNLLDRTKPPVAPRHRKDGLSVNRFVNPKRQRRIPLLLAGLAMALTVLLSGCQASSDVTTNGQGVSATHSAKAKTTAAQRQALKAAQSYVDLSGFSRAGLMKQLTLKAGSGFKKKDATYAVNHVKVNWNKEAVESAKEYMDVSAFSRSGLIHQLHSPAGSGFTVKQATYAANKVGL